MGIAIKPRKTYVSHKKRWNKSTIVDEGVFVNDYAIKNKKEIRRLELLLSKYKRIAKELNRKTLAGGSEEEVQHFIGKLKANGFLTPHATSIDEVLDIQLRNLLERRLSNIVYKKQYAKSPKQARQYVVHGHIKINGKVVTSPAYLVSLNEELTVEFVPTSALADENHPERKLGSETLVEEIDKNATVMDESNEVVHNDDSFDKKEAELDEEEVDEEKDN